MRPYFVLAMLALAGCSNVFGSTSTESSSISSSPPYTVHFESGRSSLTSDGVQVVDQAVAQYKAGAPTTTVLVAGHADSQGNQNQNLLLSAQRAITVKHALVSHGVPTTQVQMQAYGTSEPVNGDAPSAPENRRVVISW